MLRATAQGRVVKNCDWDCDTILCEECTKDAFVKHNIDPDDEDAVDEFMMDLPNEEYGRCEHAYCDCKPPDNQLSDYIDYVGQNTLSDTHHNELQQMVTTMINKYPIDYHPWSDNQVIDILHPSLYCYVKGVSKGSNGKLFEPDASEETKYQWLPSDIFINETGQVSFQTYINNLHDAEFIPLLGRTLTTFVPRLEKVLNRKLAGTACQVITKIGEIDLTPESPNYKGGSWHIEGMPYEHIVATCLYYLDVDNITDSYLEFRKPTIINEESVDYMQSDSEFTTFHFGINEHWDGVMNRYLGLVKATTGASVVFPNSLQHRVKEFKLEDAEKKGRRVIIAFFVIDPDHKIVSTADIPKQQGVMTLDDANKYREKLMYQRKYFVNTLNKEVYERPYSLCEH
jgi:hypothetical protein